jgi:hypothetical protein
MRVSLGLALVLFALAPALADEHAAMSRNRSSFELFGRSVCFDGAGKRCDVQLQRNLLETPAPSDAARRKVWRVLGVTFCPEPTATGPACDVVWTPPASTALAWQEIRMGVLPTGVAAPP